MSCSLLHWQLLSSNLPICHIDLSNSIHWYFFLFFVLTFHSVQQNRYMTLDYITGLVNSYQNIYSLRIFTKFWERIGSFFTVQFTRSYENDRFSIPMFMTCCIIHVCMSDWTSIKVRAIDTNKLVELSYLKQYLVLVVYYSGT